MNAPVGIVGRYVMHHFTRDESGPDAVPTSGHKSVAEPCEVLACEYVSGGWRLLVATHEGFVLRLDDVRSLRLVPTQNTEGGPYR